MIVKILGFKYFKYLLSNQPNKSIFKQKSLFNHKKQTNFIN